MGHKGQVHVITGSELEPTSVSVFWLLDGEAALRACRCCALCVLPGLLTRVFRCLRPPVLQAFAFGKALALVLKGWLLLAARGSALALFFTK